MKYQALKNYNLVLPKKGSEQVVDAGQGLILVPPPNSKIFLHWENENGKLVSTYTMTFTTKVYDKVKLINGSDKEVSILAVNL